MSFKHFRRPQFESLESRWVPATIKLVSGSLFISNQVGNLTVAPQATPGQVKVTDGAQSLTVSGVGSLISITGTNATNKITVDLAGNKFGGNLLINSGNGDDRVTITGTAGGTIGGSITGATGNGDDDVELDTIRVGGSLTFNMGLGFDTFYLGILANGLKIGGNVSFFNANDVASNFPCDVAGNLTIVSNENLNNFYGMGCNVGGNFTCISASGNDFVSLNQDAVVAGNVNVSLGDGNDIYRQGSGIGVAGKFDVFGHLSVNLGAGNDNFQIGNIGATIGGNATLDGGEGDNTYNLTAGMVVFGNLSVYGGNGVNDLATTAIKAQVAGGVSFNLGNGNNLITFDATSSVGGRLNVQTGNGNNTLTLQGAQTYLANIRFCSGNDTLVLNNAALVLTGYVDAGGGTNTFTQTLGTLSPNLTLIGF